MKKGIRRGPILRAKKKGEREREFETADTIYHVKNAPTNKQCRHEEWKQRRDINNTKERWKTLMFAA